MLFHKNKGKFININNCTLNLYSMVSDFNSVVERTHNALPVVNPSNHDLFYNNVIN